MPTEVTYTKDLFAPGIEKFGFKIGDYTYGKPELHWLGEPVTLVIGKYCSIADNVKLFLGGGHRTDWVTTYPFSHIKDWPEAHNILGHPVAKGDIVIGNDVWLANNSTIMGNVNIGNGAVIGANSVVAKDIEPYHIAAGNPATSKKIRFTDTEIEMLEEMKWWDWPREQVVECVDLLCSSNIQALYEKWQETKVKLPHRDHKQA